VLRASIPTDIHLPSFLFRKAAPLSKKVSLPKISILQKHIPANDNPVDAEDVPVSDQRHWTAEPERRNGFRMSETHPYRTKVRYGRDATGKWDFVNPLPHPLRAVARREYSWGDAGIFHTGDLDSVDARRTVLARKAEAATKAERPHRFRLAVLGNIGFSDPVARLTKAAEPLLATADERKWAGEGLPIEAEFRTGRIDTRLRQAAADFAEVYETANTQGVETCDRRVDARSAAGFLRYRVMHLWRPLVDALVFGKTMSAIGREYGGNKEDAAKLGRQKVIDGLLIARECFMDLSALKAQDAAAEASSGPRTDVHVTTLGRRSGELPIRLHRAANDNRRSIRDVA
jgi:hypothetical protein